MLLTNSRWLNYYEAMWFKMKVDKLLTTVAYKRLRAYSINVGVKIVRKIYSLGHLSTR